ncbi:MAG: cache domain-containing protein [Methylobacteriaceae bacterium]|nr:cache domain-containing protein [Methylobacteriaceae bacterium]
MTKRWVFGYAFAAAAALVLAALPAGAEERGTKGEAIAMAERAVALVKSKGPDAFPALSDKAGGFVDRDLYVVVFDQTGKVQAHGANNALVGVNLMNAKDPDGVPFVANILKSAAASPNGGWVPFKFTNPVSKKIERKAQYVLSVGEYALAVGVYGDEVKEAAAQ